MKRLFVYLLLCLGIVSVFPVVAQATEQLKYTVQSGDNLWNLAGAKLDDARLWTQIMEDNPFLQQDGRKFVKDGKIYVLIRPGEKLAGLEKLGIVPTLAPLDSLGIISPPKVVVEEVTPTWLWWLLAILAVMLLAALLIRRMLTANAATARDAMVPGGVNEQTARTAFQEMAARRYGGGVPSQQFQVLRQTAGRVWGVLNVRYADGKNVPRRLNGERAFRATVRFPNGREEDLYMLQACGNDLRYGGISRYLPGPDFRFEADEATQPAPAPVATTQAPAVAATTSVTGAAPTEAPAPQGDEGEDRIVVHFDAATAKQPSNLLRVQGTGIQSFTFRIGKNGPSIRFRETPEATTPAGAPA